MCRLPLLLLLAAAACSTAPAATDPDGSSSGVDDAGAAGDAGPTGPDASLDAPDAATGGEDAASPEDAALAEDAAVAEDAAAPDVGAPPDGSAFNFAILTDLHIGEGVSPEYAGEDTEAAQKLAAAVDRINLLAAAEQLEYVFVLGDISSSAQISEFLKVQQILSGLQIPWMPLLGNHDTWTYTDTSEATAPTADATFAALFQDRFVGLEHDFGPHHDPELNLTSHYLDFELRRGDTVLLGLDWNTRKHALPGWKGALGDADLHDFDGGTIQWLRARLAALPSTTRTVIFLQHHGFRTQAPIPAATFTFNSQEALSFRQALEAAPPLSRYWGVLAGHSHRDYHGTAFDEWPDFEQHELKACKDSGEYAVVRVAEDGQVFVEPGH